MCVCAQNIDSLCPLPDSTHMGNRGEREREMSAGWVMDAFRSGWQRRQQLDVGQDTHTFTHMQAKSLCDHSNEAESAKRLAKPQQHFSSVTPQLCACACTYTRTKPSGPAKIAPKNESFGCSHNAGLESNDKLAPPGQGTPEVCVHLCRLTVVSGLRV